MATYIIRRLIHGFGILILVSLLVFFVMRLLPGDPLIIYIAQTAELDTMPPEMIDKLRYEFGLDKPVMIQYINWVWGIIHGDFGTSIFYREKVGTLMLERFPITIYLGSLAMIFSGIIGIAAGLITAVRRGKWFDKVITPLTYIGITIPVFWLGILLIYLFGLKLRLLPLSGYTSPFVDFWMSIKQVIMPVFCLSIFGVAGNTRQMRSSMLEIISQDYIRTAWSKGLPEHTVILRHALKNSMIPIITLMGLSVGFIFSGSVLVETVFAIPGIGRLLVSSIFGQDYVVVQAITLVITVTILVINLLVDISYGWLDPRIRYS